MATTVPASLKSADVTRFAHRAAQLEKPKPAIAYWCNFWILNQILSKNLHNVDSEALVYTTGLMDKVEQFKTIHSTVDAIVDEVVAKAYVEQFGLEMFGKADGHIRNNKVTMATADMFQVAATVLELLGIWPPVEPEITTKIKYAKFHAVRILKAIKAGEDPNLSNPQPEPEPEALLPPLDPNDADVKALETAASGARRASVVEVQDEADKIQAKLARTSSLDQSLHPSREHSQSRPPGPSVAEAKDEGNKAQHDPIRTSAKAELLSSSMIPSRATPDTGNVSPPTPQDAASYYTSNQQQQHDVSPIDIAQERKASVGGNYFPLVSHDLPSAPAELSLPQAPSSMSIKKPPPSSDQTQNDPLNPPPPHNQQSRPSSDFTSQFAPPPQVSAIPPQSRQAQPPLPLLSPNPSIPPQYQQSSQSSYTSAPPPPPVVYASPINQPQHPPAGFAQPMAQPYVQSSAESAVADEEAIMKAQKHARWAISALNFEDVPTAIRELHGALAALGAR